MGKNRLRARVTGNRVYLGVKTCEVFLCFVAIVRVRSIMLHWTKKRIYSCLRLEQMCGKFGALNLDFICTGR